MDIFEIESQNSNYINGPLLIKPKIYNDERGYFFESWNNRIFNKSVLREINFVQDNHSKSDLGVLRGMHYQIFPKPQAKLVRCTKGSIFDVIVDLRKNSNTFKEWYGINLNCKNKYQLWIPEGFAHGFLSLKNDTEVQYKTNEYWDKDCEKSLHWDDKELKINWPRKIDQEIFQINTSEKDSNSPNLNKIIKEGWLFN